MSSESASFKQGFFLGFGLGAVVAAAPVTGFAPISLVGGSCLAVALMVSFLAIDIVFGKLNENFFQLSPPRFVNQVGLLALSPFVVYAGAQVAGISLLLSVATRVALSSSCLSLSLGYLKIMYDHSSEEALAFMGER